MNEELTRAFTLGPPPGEAPHAVLLLHGFSGSPWEMRSLGESLAARGMHVHCPRLPGHGRAPEAMLYAGLREWQAGAEAALETLRASPRVAVAGLSMGALLAMTLAERHPGLVRALVLLAPAVKLRGVGPAALRAARHLGVFDVTPQWKKKTGLDLEDPGAVAVAPVLPRYPLKRLLDLFALQDLARDASARLTCPSLVVAAVQDHVVDLDAVLALQTQLPFSQRLVLQRGFHQVLRDTDRAQAIAAVAAFLESLA